MATGIFLLLTACEKDKLEPTFRDGVIRGTIDYRQQWPQYPEGIFPLENVTVKASGPYGSITAVSNADGKYELNNVGNGTYEIEFSKKGWGATKEYSVQIYGNEVITVNRRMWKYTDFAIPALTNARPYDGWLEFRSDLPASTQEYPYLRVFYGKNSNVSCFNYEYSAFSYGWSSTDYIYYSFPLPPTGQAMYVVAYICDVNDNGEFDPIRGVDVYPSVDPGKHSPVIEY